MRPEIGKDAALESYQDIKRALKGSDLVFVIAGLGGGVGTGAIPVISQIANEVGALVIPLVTKPFTFEGERRQEIAILGLKELKNTTSNVVVLSNDKSINLFDEKEVGLKDAFKIIDNIFEEAIISVTEIIVNPNNSDIDTNFYDLKTILKHEGHSIIGVGKGKGKGKDAFQEVLENAIEFPFFDKVSLSNAKGIIIHFIAPPDVSLSAINDVMTKIHDSIYNTEVILGTTIDSTKENNEIKIVIFATGFKEKDLLEKNSLNLSSIKNKILWVDDVPDNNKYERSLFEKEEIIFDLALSTNDALEYLKKNKYLAIISDMGRKEGPQEGYVLLDKLRKMGNNIPFFFYAGSNLEEHKKMAIRRGAQGSTADSNELYEMIMEVIRQKKDGNNIDSDITFNCEDCNTQYSLNCDELEWEQTGASERNMGVEIKYEAEYEKVCYKCSNEMNITFSSWEYSLGVENHRDISSYGVSNLKGSCCFEFNVSDETDDELNQFKEDENSFYLDLEEKKETLQEFINNLIPYAELEYVYDSGEYSNKENVPSSQFLISYKFDTTYLDNLIDEIQDDLDEVEFAIDGRTNRLGDSSLLVKKQYKIEYIGGTETYGVDKECTVYEENDEKLLYIYPSVENEFNDDLIEFDDEKELAIEEMKEWFFNNYDDPANFLPYISRAGGYQYIFGGPYDVNEVLFENFSHEYSDDYIQCAIDSIESVHGYMVWAKKPNEKDYAESIYNYKKKEFLETKSNNSSINSIKLQIDGDFDGWDGNTIIKLTNGEIWQQTEYFYEYTYSYMPNVVLSNSHMGYKMKVDGISKEIGVEKLNNVIESTINGDFNGWEGDTIVELINGQKWKQSTYTYSYSYSYSPEIIIFQSAFGYKMKVEGNDKIVDVEKIL